MRKRWQSADNPPHRRTAAAVCSSANADVGAGHVWRQVSIRYQSSTSNSGRTAAFHCDECVLTTPSRHSPFLKVACRNLCEILSRVTYAAIIEHRLPNPWLTNFVLAALTYVPRSHSIVCNRIRTMTPRQQSMDVMLNRRYVAQDTSCPPDDFAVALVVVTL